MGTDPEMLLSLAKAGSGPALSRLLDRHRGALEVQARLQVGRRLRAKLDFDDLMQELSLEAHRDIAPVPRPVGGRVRLLAAEGLRDDRLQPGAALPRHAPARPATRAADRRRARRHVEGRDRPAAWSPRRARPASRPSRRERAELLADALDTLPETYREVIVLRNLEGLSFARRGRTDGPYRG